MRISTGRFFQATMDAMHLQQNRIAQLQQQLATGKRLLQPADDPAAAVQTVALKRAMAEYTQFNRNADFAEARLSLEENSIGKTEEVLQRARELAVLTASQTNGEKERVIVAQEVRQLFKQVLDFANFRDSNNEYIFAGFQSENKPFVQDNLGNVTYNGDQGQRFLNIAPDVQVAIGDPGSDVFQGIRQGNGVFVAEAGVANTGTGVIGEGTVNGVFVSDTYTIAFTQALPTDDVTYTVTGAASGVVATGTYASAQQIADGGELKIDFVFNGVSVEIGGLPADGDTFTVAPSPHTDVFSILGDFITALETPETNPADQARIQNGINRVLSDLNQAMENLVASQTKIGARRNIIENQKIINEDYSLDMDVIRSSLEDVDFPEAVSSLNREMVSLQAAQSTFVRMQNLSIFNFLN